MIIDIIEKKVNNNVVLFNKDLSSCLMYKDTVILYDYTDRIKIYNEELKGQITLDVFDNKVEVIIKEGDNIEEITSAKKTMDKNKPKIILISESNGVREEVDGYMWKTHELVNSKLDKSFVYCIVFFIAFLK